MAELEKLLDYNEIVSRMLGEEQKLIVWRDHWEKRRAFYAALVGDHSHVANFDKAPADQQALFLQKAAEFRDAAASARDAAKLAVGDTKLKAEGWEYEDTLHNRT